MIHRPGCCPTTVKAVNKDKKDAAFPVFCPAEQVQVCGAEMSPPAMNFSPAGNRICGRYVL